MNRNLVEIALQELGAEDRALLELSVVRGVSDEDIAGLLGVDIARVLIKREEALGRVSALIDEDPEQVLRTLRGLPAARWREGPPRPPPAEPEPDPMPPAETPQPVAPHPHRDSESTRSRFMLALLGGLSITLVVVVVMALTGDDDPVPAPAAPQQPAPAKGSLRSLGADGVSGNARVEDAGGRPRLVLDVKGLGTPRSGGYVVWLYNSVTDSRAVAAARRGNFTIRARLPGDYTRYRFVDISREAADGNSNHSGQSVARVPVRELR